MRSGLSVWTTFWRRARREPLSTAAVVVVLALGISAATLVLGAADAVLLRPPAFAQPERLVLLWETMSNGEPMYLSPPNFADWRDHLQKIDSLSVFRLEDVVVGADPPRVRLAGQVSGDLFRALGVGPRIGRALLPSDDLPGAAPVAVLSERAWRTGFGADPAIVGRRLPVDGVATEIVGVMPQSFAFPPAVEIEGFDSVRPAELWLPFRLDYAAGQRGAHYLCALGRLAPGATTGGAQAELDATAAAIAAAFPDEQKDWGARLVALREQAVRRVRPSIIALVVGVGALLALACANAAQLVVARTVARRRELAVRSALGASSRQVARLIVGEQWIATLVASMLAVGLTLLGLPVLRALAPAEAPWIANLDFDIRVLAVAVMTAMAVGVASSYLPLRRLRRPAAHDALRGRGAGGGDSDGGRLRRLLIAAQLAIVVPLLVVGALLVESFWRLAGVDPGFRTDGRLLARIALPATDFPNSASRRAAAARLEARLRGLPGVTSVGAITAAPILIDREGTGFRLPGVELPAGVRAATGFAEVTPGYFRTMGIPIVAGRNLHDGIGSDERAVLVNRTFVERYLGGRDPIGREIVLGFDEATARRIVGVVGDERHDTLGRAPDPNAYVPYLETGRWSRLALVLHSDGDLAELAGALGAAVSEAEPKAALFGVQPYGSIVAASVARQRFAAAALVGFALIGLALAAFGLYAVIRQAVASRRAEMAVRSALGARARDLVTLVLGEAGRLILSGILLGVAFGAAAARLVRGLLFGVSSFDPAAFLVPLVALAALALVAALGPALSAGRVSPAEALRSE